MLITNITVTSGPILGSNNLNLLKRTDIIEVKTDGFGGYLLHRRSTNQPNANGWYRAALPNLGEVRGVDEKYYALDVHGEVERVIDRDPSEDGLGAAYRARGIVAEKIALFEKLANQQMPSSKAQKLIDPLLSSLEILERWISDSTPPVPDDTETLE